MGERERKKRKKNRIEYTGRYSKYGTPYISLLFEEKGRYIALFIIRFRIRNF